MFISPFDEKLSSAFYGRLAYAAGELSVFRGFSFVRSFCVLRVLCLAAGALYMLAY